MKYMPVLMPWTEWDTPHCVIEVNQNCNIRCHGCFKDRADYKKSVDLIKEEIDLIAVKRNLAAITLGGGEPLLYQDLAEVIRHITGKGLRSLLLTNGVLLSKEKMIELRDAGLSRVLVHVDSHQTRDPKSKEYPDERQLNELRRGFVDRGAAVGLNIAFCMTTYRDTLDQIPAVVDYFHEDRRVEVAMLTCYSQDVNLNPNARVKDDGLSIDDVDFTTMMIKGHDAYPVYYIPLNSGKEKLGLFYYMALLSHGKNGAVTRLYLHPKHRFFLGMMMKMLRKREGHFVLESPISGGESVLLALAYGFFSFNPVTWFRAMAFLFRAAVNRSIRTFMMNVQLFPKRLGDNKFVICEICQDVTVRNGKVIPYCIADMVEPIP